MSSNQKDKILLFSLKHSDFELSFFPCGTKGGQSANRDHSGCRISHKESGAVAEGREFKSQGQNKEAAFKRLVESKTFKSWHRLECARRLLGYQNIEAMVNDKVTKSLFDKNLKFEVRDEDGKWITVTSDHFNQTPVMDENEYMLMDFCNEK